MLLSILNTSFSSKHKSNVLKIFLFAENFQPNHFRFTSIRNTQDFVHTTTLSEITVSVVNMIYSNISMSPKQSNSYSGWFVLVSRFLAWVFCCFFHTVSLLFRLQLLLLFGNLKNDAEIMQQVNRCLITEEPASCFCEVKWSHTSRTEQIWNW